MGKISNFLAQAAPVLSGFVSGPDGDKLKQLLSGDGLSAITSGFDGPDGLGKLADLVKGGKFDLGSVIQGAHGGTIAGVADAISGVELNAPPSDDQRKKEAQDIVDMQKKDHSAATIKRAEDLDANGAWGVWQDKAKAFRAKHPGLEGWLVTAKMDAAIAAAGAAAYADKGKYDLARPWKMRSDIEKHGKVETDSSYPSGHSAASAAAAAVLSAADPENAKEYTDLANDVQWARQYSGMHLKSDTEEGARIGREIAAKILAANGGSGGADAAADGAKAA